MERPVMNPMFMEDHPDPAAANKRPRRRERVKEFALRALKRVGKFLFRPVSLFRRGEARVRIEDGTPLQRFVRAALYRLAFAPVLLVLFVVTVVFAATHPPRVAPQIDPLTQGVYYDPIDFAGEDGARLEGWLVPVFDARKIVEEKEKGLQKKHPAVVLVHDFAASREQLLPLVRPLHEIGLVVLAVGTRGSEATSGRYGQTFGLREASDVRAAVQMLRRRPYVDANRVAVFGIGTGANAAVLAAETDPAIVALVLDKPVDGFDRVFTNRVGERHARWLKSMLPMCRWTFEMMYRVDADGLDLADRKETLESRPVLVHDVPRTGTPLEPHDVPAVAEFLKRHAVEGAPKTALTSAGAEQ